MGIKKKKQRKLQIFSGFGWWFPDTWEAETESAHDLRPA
jgi:hypothetical protein